MKTETKTFAEYKAPKCKMVTLHIEGTIMDGYSGYYEEGEAGDGQVIGGGNL